MEATDQEQYDLLLQEGVEEEEQEVFRFETQYPYLDSIIHAWLQAHEDATLDLRICFEGSDGLPAHHRISAALGPAASPIVLTFVDSSLLGSQANLCGCVLKARLAMESITDVQVVTEGDEWSSLLPVMKAWENQLQAIATAQEEDDAMVDSASAGAVELEDEEEEAKYDDRSTLWLLQREGFPLTRQTANTAWCREYVALLQSCHQDSSFVQSVVRFYRQHNRTNRQRHILEVLEHTRGVFTPAQVNAVKASLITPPGFPIPAEDVVGMREYGSMLRTQLPGNWHCYDADEVAVYPSAAQSSDDDERYAILNTPLQRGWQVHLSISDKGQLYAAKELSSDEFRSAKEHHIMNRLNHPNVCRVFGSVAKRHGGGGWLIMELGGKTLRQMLQQHETRRVPMLARLSILRSILDGVSYLHTLSGQATRAVAHRDIKTDNIVIKLYAEEEKAVSPQALIIDFGSARQARTSNQFSFTSPRGTDGYRAPELSLRATYTSRVDVFSMGVVAYEVLHLCHPFGEEGATNEALQNTIDRTPDYAILPAWNRIDRYHAITRLLLRMMSRDPSKRPTARWCLIYPCLWTSELMLSLIRLWRDPLRQDPSAFNAYFFKLSSVPQKSSPWSWRDNHTEVLSALKSPDYSSPSGLVIALRDYYHHGLQTDLKQRARQLSVPVIGSVEELVLRINEAFPRIDFMATLVRAMHECWVNIDGWRIGERVYTTMWQSQELHVLAVRCRDLLRSWYPDHKSRFKGGQSG